MGGDQTVGKGSTGAGLGTLALVPGDVVAGRYQLSHMLGTGGMGVVWAARDVDSQELLALKFLRPGLGVDDPDAKKRFLREARAAASVRHDHVVAIRDVLELDDFGPVMVMEMLTGETLRKRLGRGPRLTLEETAGILLPVASAVGTAHSQGIVHRDLKPDNIFLSQDASGAAVVKVLDFGIAKVSHVEDASGTAVGLTGSGDVLGTPNYMSPEQVFGERDIDQRADIWALGVILYECLSGSVPTKANNVGQVFKLIVAGGMKPLGHVVPGLPPEIAALADRMLSRARDRRPFDLNEIAACLGRHTTMVVPTFGAPHLPRRGALPAMDESRGAEPAPNADETLRPHGAEMVTGAIGETVNRARRGRLGRLTTVGLGVFVVSVMVGQSLVLWRLRANKAAQAKSALPAAVITRPAVDGDGKTP